MRFSRQTNAVYNGLSSQIEQERINRLFRFLAACQCYGHSRQCRYDPEVDRNKGSLDVRGRREGGGVCIDCLHNTAGK